MITITYVKKVGRNTVHIMKNNIDDSDNYEVYCGQMFNVCDSDISEAPPTCKLCIKFMNKHRTGVK